ncbi:hypothetical protein BG261_05455 [Floricoccus tropicus]|uniref:Uncharacterized protein n=1 Tax=Floricoccus tropicus TaxID=1859473 RepID=A0A1E8GLH0_9LACT|nr:hypothetical protein [Floricoccus tropicus]OFI48836.1 hypothetical protein BG261_05455 [Floricoccus tropicus]
MAKTLETKKCEKALWGYSQNMGTFGCFEVKIGFDIKNIEIVDYITINTKSEIRAYEIKVSENDFNSSAKLSFVGDYNYMVMPKELFEKLRDKKNEKLSRLMFSGVGFLTVDERGAIGLVRKPNKKMIYIEDKIKIQSSILRSLSREVKKAYKQNPYWEEIKND